MTVRTVFEIEIELLSPASVPAPASVPGGAMGFDGEIGPHTGENVDQTGSVDSPLSRTAAGDPYVPCSSLVGSLRSHLMARDPSAKLARILLGGQTLEDEPEPSALRFLGSWVEASMSETTPRAGSQSDPGSVDSGSSAGLRTHTRTRTSIDRKRGAPADKHLWSEKLLMSPARILLIGLTDIDLSDYWEYIKTWRPRVGGMRSSGFGEARISSIRHGTVDLRTPDGCRKWLKSVSKVDSNTNGRERFAALFTHDDAVKEDAAEIESNVRSRPLIVDVSFEIVDEFLIDGALEDVDQGREGDATSIFKSSRRPDGHVWIEGTSWKGLFRSRCEFILNSLDVDACSPDHTNDEKAHSQRTAEGTPCECLICEMFGSPRVRGSLEFCSSKILEEEDRVLTRISVDRITGGAAKGRLFNIEGLTRGTVGLKVYWTKGEEIPDVVGAMLEAVVRDIDDGYVGIGALTSRGFGTVRLSSACDPPKLANIVELLQC